MKKNSMFFIMTLLIIMSFNICFGAEISLSDDSILLNGAEITNENLEGIVYSNEMNNGSSEDLAKEANIKIDNVITITKAGEYTFTGSLSNGQIAVNANEINGEVKIILNNVSITSNDAPAIFIYSKDIQNDKCKVTIETAKGSENTVVGGRIKQSVLDFTKQDEILYSIEKNYDDDGTYYERYKYDGAISSDISFSFDGEGILNVYGNGKEGIEGKMHITVNGGMIIIKSVDDAINAAADGKSIITVNDGMVVAFLTDEAEEGDGIDSNGTIVINGGKVYSFACPGADSGLDADGGTTINGGEVISTGSMNDTVKFGEGVNYARASFNNINAGEIICVADEKENIIFVMETDRVIKNFLYTSNKLENGKEYAVYTNANIEGTKDEWNIYTNITSKDTSNATKNDFNEMRGPGFMGGNFNNMSASKDLKTPGIILLFIAIVSLIIVIIINIKNKNEDMKIRIINLVLGIIIGATLSLGIYFFVINNNIQRNSGMREFPYERPTGNMGEMDFQNKRGETKNFEGNLPQKLDKTNQNTI